MSGYFDWLPWRRQPTPPSGCVHFITRGNHMGLNVNVTLTDADQKVAIAKRTVTVTINGGTPVVLDATSGHASTPCNDGDQVNVSAVSTSAGGIDSAPATWSGIAHDNVTVPASPVLAVSFTPASS